MPTAKPAIRVEDLGKCYQIYARPQDRLKQLLAGKRRKYHQEHWAVRGVSFDVAESETLGIIGKNGAGKTTILKMIAGTLEPTEGHVQIGGRVTALLELGSGFSPEFTGRENVYLNGSILGLSRRQMDERFDAIAAFADIGDFIDRPVKTYSKGMFVRLAFSVMANLDPDIFIVDEALAVGDAYFRHRCMLRFHEMKQRGTTILYVSHDASSMKRLCDRIAWIDKGRLRQIGPSSIVADQYLADLFKRTPAASEPGDGGDAAPARPATGLPAETRIDHVDRRLGDGALRIRGVCLYNAKMQPIGHSDVGQQVVLRMTVRNQTVDRCHHWLAGYILRNRRGEEIASTNTDSEKVDLPALPVGVEQTVQFHIQLPLLCPGSYTLSPAAAYVSGEGQPPQLADRCDNAVMLELTSQVRVHCLMALPTRVVVEMEVHA